MTKSRPRLVTLRSQTFSRSYKNEKLQACRECGEGFHIGDEIVTKKNRSRTMWYHKQCAVKLNIWWDRL